MHNAYPVKNNYINYILYPGHAQCIPSQESWNLMESIGGTLLKESDARVILGVTFD